MLACVNNQNFLDFSKFFGFLDNYFGFLDERRPKGGPKSSKGGPKGLGLEVELQRGPRLVYIGMNAQNLKYSKGTMSIRAPKNRFFF